MSQAASTLTRALRQLAAIHAKEKTLKAKIECLHAELASTKLELETGVAMPIYHAEELMRELNTLKDQFSELNE